MAGCADCRGHHSTRDDQDVPTPLEQGPYYFSVEGKRPRMRPVTRRSILAVGGATAATALAGCSGGSNTADGGTTTSPPVGQSPDSLAVENLHVCAEKPTGYRQYTEQPDATYEPSETVWVYFEPSTVGTESAGEGEVRFAFEIEWTIHGPDGEAIDTLIRTAERTVPASADLSELYLWMDFAPTAGFDPGTHRTDLTVTDAVAGNTAKASVEFDVERPVKQAAGTFGIPEIVFTTDVARSYDDYERQPNAEYGPHAPVSYYAQVDGVHYVEKGGAKVLDLSIHATLTGPEGERWIDEDLSVSNEMSGTADLSTYWIADRFAPNDRWLVGDYTLTLEVTDGYTGGTSTASGTYTVTA